MRNSRGEEVVLLAMLIELMLVLSLCCTRDLLSQPSGAGGEGEGHRRAETDNHQGEGFDVDNEER